MVIEHYGNLQLGNWQKSNTLCDSNMAGIEQIYHHISDTFYLNVFSNTTKQQNQHQQLPKYVIGNYCMRRLFTICVMTVLGVNIDIKHVIDYLVNSKQQINFRQEFLDHQNLGKVLL